MNKIVSAWLLPCAVLFAAFFSSGCQTYHPKPLPTEPDLMQSPALTVPVGQFNLPELKPHPFPTNGLDETAVITLAVFNNPDLKAARTEARVADAELIEAGLLPDPQVSAGIAKSPAFVGYNVGLSEDLQALITRGAAKAAARAHGQQVNLDILWQEYQVAEKAKELFIQLRADDELRPILTTTRDLLAGRYKQDKAAFQQGNVSADTASADLTAFVDADRNLHQLELDANQTRHDLNLLLGLEPDVQLHLIGHSESKTFSPDDFRVAVAALAHHRADLLALQAGYQSQEQTLREAVLAQFPSMSVGIEPARDPVEGVSTIGLNVNVTLPLFNRNQGQIDIQRATREVLYQTYQARLDQAASDADRVWKATLIMSNQVRDAEALLPALEKSAMAADENFQQGNLNASTYFSIKVNFQTEETEAIRLRVSLEQARAALEILLGLPLTDWTSSKTKEVAPRPLDNQSISCAPSAILGIPSVLDSISFSKGHCV